MYEFQFVGVWGVGESAFIDQRSAERFTVLVHTPDSKSIESVRCYDDRTCRINTEIPALV